MSNNFILNNFLCNKKSQYYPRPSYGFIHPLLIIGVGVFVLPYLMPIWGASAAGWFETTCMYAGTITILFGAVLSIVKASE